MQNRNFNTTSEAINTLTKEGFTENFKAQDECIEALYSKKEYQPNDLEVVAHFRFEGMTNPSDQTEIFAIQAKDGTKGTLSMSYSSSSNQNDDLIKAIPKAS